MSSTTQQPTESPPAAKSEALQPILDNLPDEPTESYALLANLTTLQQKILIELAGNVLAEDIRTDSQIARDIGCSDDYIYQLRRNPKFTAAMGTVIREIARGTSDKAFNQLLKHAQKDTKATEIWLRMSETYQPTNRNVNVNANLQVNAGAPGSPQQAHEAYVRRFMSIGYDLESLVDAVRSTYQRLKDEGL